MAREKEWATLTTLQKEEIEILQQKVNPNFHSFKRTKTSIPMLMI
jgi:hypothetical protein